MRTINHHNFRLALLSQRLFRSCYTCFVEVRPSCSTPQNNKTVRIPCRLRNSRQALLRHTHEMMLRGRRTNRINSHPKSTVCAVLEAHRKGKTGREFAVKLRFRRPGANSTKTDEVGEELGADGVEHLCRDGHALVREVAEEFAAYAQPFVDLEGLVDVGVVDEAFPADGCSWLF